MIEDNILRVGDVVRWKHPERNSEYTPSGPYVIGKIYRNGDIVKLRCLDGRPLYFELGDKLEDHAGVSSDDVVLDVFLTAARRACEK